ncbi:MAG: hypothetical protein WD156_03870 [Acidimicrobiia bacterium]
MTGPPPLMVEARRVLLDALDALAEHRASLVLVGAQAVYLRTDEIALSFSASHTTDADLAIDPTTLADTPLLAELMTAAGFTLTEPDRPSTGSSCRKADGLTRGSGSAANLTCRDSATNQIEVSERRFLAFHDRPLHLESVVQDDDVGDVVWREMAEFWATHQTSGNTRCTAESLDLRDIKVDQIPHRSVHGEDTPCQGAITQPGLSVSDLHGEISEGVGAVAGVGIRVGAAA